MVSFDIIDAANYGYRQAWRHRRYLLRLAVIPLLVNIACLVTVSALKLDERFLRQAVVMLPSLFTQGWMLSHYTRLLFLGQTWPFQKSEDASADRAALNDRMQGIAAGTLTYTLSRFALFGITQLFYQLNKITEAAKGVPTPPAMQAALLAVLAVILTFWSFRLLWFFIPAAINQSMTPVLKGIRGFAVSFFMMATWLVCYVPLMTLCRFVIAPGDAPVRPALDVGRIAVDSVCELAVALIVTGGMAYAFRAMLGARKAKR